MKRALISLMVVLGLAAPVFAQSSGKHDTSKPIEIAADNLEVLQKQQQAIFSGNVVATQGEINLRSDKMTVYYREQGGDANGISRILVDGHVFLATPKETARGTNGVYDVDKKTITLAGDVVLTREKNVLKGSRLDYNLDSGRSVIVGDGGTEGGGKAGRVRGLFVPKQE